MSVTDIKIKDYTYSLPDSRIAKYPLAHRDESKLLVYDQGSICHDVFKNVSRYIPEGSLLVYNNTKVIYARLHFRKENNDATGQPGALIEVFLLEPETPRDYEQMFQSKGHCSWVCMIGNLKKWREGITLSRTVRVGEREVVIKAERGEEKATGWSVSFTYADDVSFAEILEAMGELPIPPYLNRKSEESDKTTYQTVYSKIKGSVAAPTAGLHFTPEVLSDIDAHNIERQEVTLHVGAGTFRPVKSEEIGGHVMHQEYICVSKAVIERIIAHEGHAIAVGTTSVRTLESLYYIGRKILDNPNIEEEKLIVEQWEPYENKADSEEIPSVKALGAIADWLDRNGLTALHTSTKIIIVPGYHYHIVNRLITNFHQPQSTLLLLVSAFIGEDWRKVYEYALNNDFRFLSYGDSSILIPKKS